VSQFSVAFQPISCGLPVIIFYFCFSSLTYAKLMFSISLNNTGAHAHSMSTLEVPIFWFISGEPLLVDKHYQAKALSDMVIVVQSEPSSWESHLQCNGQSVLWDLRLEIRLSHLVFITGLMSTVAI